MTKYIYKESIKSFVIGMIVFTFVLVLNNLFQLMDLLINKGAGVLVVTQLITYLVMSLFTVTVPMSLLFSVLLTYGRMSEDREITALSSAGINTFRFTFQPLLLALVLSLMLSWLNLEVLPKIHSEFSRIYFTIAKKQPLMKFEEKALTKLGNYRIYINEIDNNANELRGVNIYKISPPAGNTQIIAKSGTANIAENAITFNLKDGILQATSSDDSEKLTQFAFDNYLITISLFEEQKNNAQAASTLREISSEDLLKEIKFAREHKTETARFETEYNLRWVIGFAALCLVLIGLPTGIITNRGGRTVGFALSLGIICAYYFILIGSISATERIPKLPIALVLWLPNICAFTVGLFLMIKLLKR
ncbi:MAG: LptF/LptG family permease [Elusimicrobiota bacterium]